MKNLIGSMLVIFMSLSNTAWAEEPPANTAMPRGMSASIKDITAADMPRQSAQENNLPDSNQQNAQPVPLLSDLPSTRRSGEKQSVINNFCSNITRKNVDASQLSCIDAQKQEACERFERAPVNIQRVMVQAIDCEADTNSGHAKSDCDSSDASRLDLLKQYWDDEDSSYTVLFLPDMVFNAAASCEAPAAAKSEVKQ